MIPFAPWSHLNSSVHGPVEGDYDVATRAIVAQIYADDFAAFGDDSDRFEAGVR